LATHGGGPTLTPKGGATDFIISKTDFFFFEPLIFVPFFFKNSLAPFLCQDGMRPAWGLFFSGAAERGLRRATNPSPFLFVDIHF
jgi:hypothetical protein